MIVIGPAVVEWVAKRTNEFGNFGCAQGIGVTAKGELIAGVVYNEFNGANCCMHVAALPGRMWLKYANLRVWFDYPFNQMKVKRVTALIGEGNTASRRLTEHLGFERETTLRGAHPTGDLIVYAMWKERCEWISPDFEKRYAKAA